MCDDDLADEFEGGEYSDTEGTWEPTEEEIARIKRSMQDCNDGLTYTLLFGDDHEPWDMKCNKCGRVGNMMEKPFPHKLDCPMRGQIKD